MNNNKTKTKKELLLDVFFSMDNNEWQRHTAYSLTSLMLRSNIVSEEALKEVNLLLHELHEEDVIEAKRSDTKGLEGQFTFKLTGETRQQYFDKKREKGIPIAEGCRGIYRDYPYNQNLQYLQEMGENLFRFC